MRDHYVGGPSSHNLVLTGFLLHQQRRVGVEKISECSDPSVRFQGFDGGCSDLEFMTESLKEVRHVSSS